MLDAKNKVIVITGASAGLGRALAMEAGHRKARVVLLARGKTELEKVRKLIIESGGEALVLPTDMTKPPDVALSFAEIESRWSRVDILFNVAGVVEPVKRLVNAGDDEIVQSLMINVLGVYIGSREAVKIMQKQLSGGTIINITSGAAKRVYVGWSLYGSQKAAVDHFTRVVAEELKETPIRIAALSPGPFDSHMQKVMRGTDISDFPVKDRFVELHRSGKLATPEQLAPMILDIALTDWPELSGRVEDIRDGDFQRLCFQNGVLIPDSIRK
ncbi:MAG: hypothetical protein CVT49_05700 [candidate division Zixibacteria bacterium HGW-Zixibacteria-1]|nr:MAG: hypothetical protein CVT49_05700 [candidate division Zixibacteria bacterium HGW-Zixibacteria-1]